MYIWRIALSMSSSLADTLCTISGQQTDHNKDLKEFISIMHHYQTKIRSMNSM